ncbi:MAG: hypothetical protein JZD41_03660 [Thermoproteus sp.]|nr:hypothetical protein [Thermoproteus sp.]
MAEELKDAVIRTDIPSIMSSPFRMAFMPFLQAFGYNITQASYVFNKVVIFPIALDPKGIFAISFDEKGNRTLYASAEYLALASRLSRLAPYTNFSLTHEWGHLYFSATATDLALKISDALKDILTTDEFNRIKVLQKSEYLNTAIEILHERLLNEYVLNAFARNYPTLFAPLPGLLYIWGLNEDELQRSRKDKPTGHEIREAIEWLSNIYPFYRSEVYKALSEAVDFNEIIDAYFNRHGVDTCIKNWFEEITGAKNALELFRIWGYDVLYAKLMSNIDLDIVEREIRDPKIVCRIVLLNCPDLLPMCKQLSAKEIEVTVKYIGKSTTCTETKKIIIPPCPSGGRCQQQCPEKPIPPPPPDPKRVGGKPPGGGFTDTFEDVIAVKKAKVKLPKRLPIELIKTGEEKTKFKQR